MRTPLSSGATCLAPISMATFARYRFVPIPAVAVMPVVRSTSRMTVPRQLLRRLAVGAQIRRYVDEDLVDGIDVNVLRREIFEVDLIDLRGDTYIVRHLRRRGDEGERQLRVRGKRVRVFALAAQLSARARAAAAWRLPVRRAAPPRTAAPGPRCHTPLRTARRPGRSFSPSAPRPPQRDLFSTGQAPAPHIPPTHKRISDRSPDTPVPPPFRFCPYHTTKADPMQALLENLFDLEDKIKLQLVRGRRCGRIRCNVTEGGWASQPKQGSPDLLA